MTRDQLLGAVWSAQIAADERLTRAVSELHRVLQDGAPILLWDLSIHHSYAFEWPRD